MRKVSLLVSFFISLFFLLILKFDFLSSIGIGFFSFWVVQLILNSDEYIPLMELFFSLYSLQFLLGPALSYNGFDEYTILSYRMKISPERYFSYILPLFIAFPLGYRVYFTPHKFKVDKVKLDLWLSKNYNLPYYFIIIGFIAPAITQLIPNSFAFVAYLLESFKFIGLFILILSSQKIKPILLIGIYSGVLISSFVGGMFHDLLIWLIVLGLILSNKYRPTIILKLVAIGLFAIFASFIQSVKMGLRGATWEGNENVSLSLIENISKENATENSGFFTKSNLGPQINRINQGWILASTIDNVPLNEPHSNGELTFKYFYSAFMPRFLAPEKLKAGDQNIFNKYSGHSISDETAMGLGLFTDAYVEFGNYGAILYVFLWGTMYGFILQQFLARSVKYPILILFSILAFVYPMRPDCETQTVLGHLFKTIMLLAVIFYFFKNTFKENGQGS